MKEGNRHAYDNEKKQIHAFKPLNEMKEAATVPMEVDDEDS